MNVGGYFYFYHIKSKSINILIFKFWYLFYGIMTSLPVQTILPFVSEVKLRTLPPTLQEFFKNKPVETFTLRSSPLLLPVNIKLLLLGWKIQHKICALLGSFSVLKHLKSLAFHSLIVASKDTLAIKSLLADQSKA